MFQWASGEFMHCQKSTPELLTLCMVLNLRNSAAAGGHTARRERHTMRTVAVQHSHVCVRALASAGERWRAHRTQNVARAMCERNSAADESSVECGCHVESDVSVVCAPRRARPCRHGTRQRRRERHATLAVQAHVSNCVF